MVQRRNYTTTTIESGMKRTLIARRTGLLLGVAGLLIAPVTRIALPGLASQAAARASQAAPASSISTERIADHVGFLASDELQGRRAGTPEADRAANYIAAQFK